MNVSVMAMANLVGSGWVGGEGAQGGLVDGERVLGGHRLDADVVGAGGDVLLDAGAHRVGIAPGDQRVEEVVGGAVDVLVGEAEPEPVVPVVRQGGVHRQGGPGGVAGDGGIGDRKRTRLNYST